MNLIEATAKLDICKDLTGKTLANKYIQSLFIAPAGRERTLEIMELVKHEHFSQVRAINSQYEFFEMFVLFYNKAGKRYEITPLEEVVATVFQGIST